VTLSAGTQIGPYCLEALIGAGGMGEVYRAHDSRLDRFVAIKVLPAAVAGDPERMRRFEREARATAGLEHPHILRIHDIGTYAEQPYIVSELLEGESLHQRIRRGALTFDEIIDYAIQICDGLDAAHGRGIVHRDIKPANVFVTTRGQIKILDFGLARMDARPSYDTGKVTVPLEGAGESSATEPGVAMGTVSYMSPEQARGEIVDTRSDLFSFGITIYEMATGQPAFHGSTHALIYDSILNRPTRPLCQVNPAMPRELQRIVDRCLQKRPQARYQYSNELLGELRSLRRIRDSGSARSESGLTRTMPSIAVLPFVDMSPQKDQDYFCEGMAEELINALATLPGLHVASRTSAFQFKGQSIDISEVGARLRVEAILEGSVRKAGQRLRITAQLVNSSDGYQIWSERYDRDMDDVFAVQDEIARTIVAKLKVRLTGDPDAPLVRHRTRDLEAYNLYLKGRYHWSRRGEFLSRAVECFTRAIALDPSYAQAYAGLADSYGVLGIYGILSSIEAAEKARPAAERALVLDDTLAEVHRSLAAICVSFDWDLAAGERAYRRALELNPNSGEVHAMYAYCLTYMLRFDEAYDAIARARTAEPESILVAGYSAVNLMFSRRYEEALEETTRCLQLDSGSATAEWIRAQVFTRLGQHDAACRAAERAVTLTRGQSFYRAAFAMAAAAAGRRDEADAIAQELEARSSTVYVSPLWFADIAVALGDTDRALIWLDRAFERRTQALVSLGVSPHYDPLRSDARFQELLRGIGVPNFQG
jgi:serine/threonine protein kinase